MNAEDDAYAQLRATAYCIVYEQCCGAVIIYFRLRIQFQLLPYSETLNCNITAM